MLKKLEKFSLPELEEKVLEFWKTNDIFGKSLAKNAKKKKFIFYEGPPTANGRPGIHHILARSFKDIIPRYKTMAGFSVPRRAGWDTHGLPVELEVEKKLGLKSKKEIEKFGIAEFNQKCKESVWQYKDEWEKLTERMGFWLDLKNPYVTYENSYIESVWSILKRVWDKKLLYKGHKVVPWCPRCGTGLSSHELALGYKETTDTSVYVRFRLKIKPEEIKGRFNSEDISILSWTTTPWTLPGNVALAINPKLEYVAVFTNRYGPPARYYILEKNSLERLKSEIPDLDYTQVPQKIEKEFLLNRYYEPLFDVSPLESKDSYRIYPADFVTTTDGTGVVHTAVMYGEDDYNLGKKIGLPQHHTVDEQGKFTKDVKGFEGMPVKAKETEDKIFGHLKDKDFLLKTEPYKHEYPFCWRCNTPLIYYACDSWFIAMSKLRPKLLAANKKINWVPGNIKDGRFGEWLKEAKDWAISRERYWGTPLPIWVCDKCGHEKFIGSIAELESGRKKSSNRYILARHGEAENNVKNIIDHVAEKSVSNLTLKGRSQIEKLAKKLSREKIDVVFASDFPRTRQTAEILALASGIKKVNLDKRLREVNMGFLNGRQAYEYHRLFPNDMKKFTRAPEGGETLNELRKRLYEFIEEKEMEFSGKTILVVSHEYPIWIFASVLEGWGNREAVEEHHRRGGEFISNKGEVQEYRFRNLPRNENGEMDVHRPYLDAIQLPCEKCDDKMERVREVIDVWFDSGAMPFAQAHYPLNKKIEYPADYISEAMDQTRGWFYTLLAIGVLMGKDSPYKNVVCLGLIMDKNGQKMSKSKGNIVDPWEAMRKHGVDAIRWYFYTVNPPGEPKKFDEFEITKTSRQLFSLLYNSFLFFETYRAKNSKSNPPAGGLNPKSFSVLDRWILSRLHETIGLATENLDKFNIGDAGRTIEDFVGDLSRWYIRRSRRRFQKPESSIEGQNDHENASNILGYALLETSKLIAPFAPFFAEALYKSLNAALSVHLEDWPKAENKYIDKKLSSAMDETRKFASAVLAKRAEAGIKVRQPLAKLKIRNPKSEILNNRDLTEILKDEINVKDIGLDAGIKEDFELDTNITHELKEEGILRELTRAIQGFRQDAKLKPQDIIGLFLDGPEELKIIVSKYGETLKKDVKAESIELKRSSKFDAELETKVDEMPIWIGIKK